MYRGTSFNSVLLINGLSTETFAAPPIQTQQELIKLVLTCIILTNNDVYISLFSFEQEFEI